MKFGQEAVDQATNNPPLLDKYMREKQLDYVDNVKGTRVNMLHQMAWFYDLQDN